MGKTIDTMNSTGIVGRLIGASITGYQFSCSREEMVIPQVGSLVSANLATGLRSYGVVCNIRWAADGLITQLASSPTPAIETGVLLDNQLLRTGGPVIDVALVGYEDSNLVYGIPPLPPITLELIWLCESTDFLRFTKSNGYLRLLIAATSPDIVAAHLQVAHQMHLHVGHTGWVRDAVDYLSGLLVSDGATLSALAEAVAHRIPDHYF